MNALLVGVAFAVGAPALKDKPKDEQAILGDWKLVGWLQGTEVRQIADGQGTEFLPDGKRLVREGPGEPDPRTYRLYPKTDPFQVDLARSGVGPGPAVYPCIFKIDGGKLVIAVGPAGGERPKSFDPAECYMLMTYTRLKKKD